MAPFPPLTPPPPEPPGTRVRVRTRSAVSDENDARQDAAEIILAKLRAMIAAGTQEADAILGTIAVATHALTGAGGAAIAMPRDGAVVCVGRSGDTAPELGALLDVNKGISGECLRSGMILRCDDAARDFKVDLEVCRQLGLQSIAVVPLRGQHGRVGVLEVFSTQSYAFTEEHVALLERLAGLAEAAWARGAATEAAVPEDLSTPDLIAQDQITQDRVTADQVTEDQITEDQITENPAIAGRAIAATVDRDSHFASASVALGRVGKAIATGLQRERQSERKLHIALVAGFSVVVVFLLSVVGWKTWYKASIQSTTNRTAASSQVSPAEAGNGAAGADVGWKPGAERSLARPHAAPETHAVKSTATVKMPDDVIRRRSRSPRKNKNADTESDSPPQTANSAPNPTDLPEIASSSAGPTELGSALSASPALPKLDVPISQGVAGGILVHKVQPSYPSTARQARLHGTVILEGTVTEHGEIEDLKVISGHPILAQAAMEAVSKWRYTPNLLNGKPISKQTRISINFIAP
jgi:periplasmic protein TonB